MYDSHFHTEYQPSQADPRSTQDEHQSHGIDRINQPILFTSGQFAGQTIRAELREVQQADLGRKYARVDRRPLDPPPVVHLRLFDIYNAGTEQESEEEISNYEEVQVLGLLCTVDLFPLPLSSSTNHKISSPYTQRLHSAPPGQVVAPPTPAGPSQFPIDPRQHYTFVPSHTYAQSLDHTLDRTLCPSPTHTSLAIPGYMPQPPTSPAVHHVDGFPIMENSKMTHSLVGATFVQPAIVEYQGRKAIMFVFSDLAVKVEGSFILRYRIFDIFSTPYGYTSDLAIQAECYGGAFRVYSTKEFPGLQASTELTKQLARWGVRLNTRETERKRRKKGDARSASPLYAGATGRKRKLHSYTNNDATAYESDDE